MNDRRIKSVAVLGAGTMGTGIAAACASAGCKTAMLDLTKELADKGKGRMSLGRFPMLDDPGAADLITTGSFDESFELVAEADWICEAVIEDLEIKRSIFSKVEQIRKPVSVVSTNTSGIPLRSICAGMSEQFNKDVAVTHFFNPVKVMRLLEVVPGEDTTSDVVDSLVDYCRNTLGKGVVVAKDTVNFIGNRIGCFWMLSGLHKGGQARKYGVSVDRMDALMSVSMGIPSTGLFGLIDLVGLDVMRLVADNLDQNLPQDDVGRAYVQLPEKEQAMLTSGQLGRKTGGGFYRMLKNEDGSRLKEKFDPESGNWSPAEKFEIEKDPCSLMFESSSEGQFVWNLVSETLCYAADLIPEISDDIVNIDRAMRWGFNWQKGPFQLLDSFGNEAVIQKLQSEGRQIPRMLRLLQASGNSNFYDQENNRFFGDDGEFHEIPEE